MYVRGVELVTLSRVNGDGTLHENGTGLEHSYMTAVFPAYFFVYINPSCMILLVVIVIVLVMFKSGNVTAIQYLPTS